VLKAGIPLGRIFGISIRLHYSWFFIFVLITWALAAGYFPDSYPDWDMATYWGIGLATSLLFFLSVLIHELSHSLVAQTAGIPIRAITLFIFGGVSQISKEPEKPDVEFRMAIAGPLSSLALGGIFWVIHIATLDVSEPLTALTFWLAWINAVLAGFNLIPGFPMDGGRVLRSIIWWRTHNLRRATRIASTIGRGVGYLFIFGGIFWIFWGSWLNGLWLVLIGWFLETAAAGSYQQVAFQDLLSGHRVSEVMTRDCPVVSPGLTVEQLVHEYFLNSGRRCFPVVDNGRLLGLISLNDVKAVPHDLRPVRTVRETMTPFERLKWVRPQDDLSNVLQLITTEDVNQLPVIENNSIVGMVARDSLLSFIRTRSELGVRS
jgi:Zn-dependent protease/CBS domain-containing protein